MNILEKKEFEVEKLKELNFLLENQIKETDFMILRARKDIAKTKSFELAHEERREIFFLNNANCTFTNLAAKNHLKEMRNKFNKITKERSKNKKQIEEIEEEIEKIKKILEKKRFTKRYINTQDIIEEDEFDGREYSDIVSTMNIPEEFNESLMFEENLSKNNTLNDLPPIKDIIPPLDLNNLEEKKRREKKKDKDRDSTSKEEIDNVERETNQIIQYQALYRNKSTDNIFQN